MEKNGKKKAASKGNWGLHLSQLKIYFIISLKMVLYCFECYMIVRGQVTWTYLKYYPLLFISATLSFFLFLDISLEPSDD